MRNDTAVKEREERAACEGLHKREKKKSGRPKMEGGRGSMSGERGREKADRRRGDGAGRGENGVGLAQKIPPRPPRLRTSRRAA